MMEQLKCDAQSAGSGVQPATADVQAEAAEAQSSELPAISEEVAALNEYVDFDTLENYEFGGKIAQQVGADLSGDREEKRPSTEQLKREAAMAAAARPQDWKSAVARMSFDERVEATLECLGRKNNQKEILYDLLVYCTEERTEEETEAFLTAHKQFADGYHTASKYLLFMQRTGALEELEYDSDGVLVTDEMREELREMGAPEEEIEDLGDHWHYLTTEEGKRAIERFDPADRTRAMLETQSQLRVEAFKRLLDFCEQPRSLAEIEQFMAHDPGLEIDARTGVMRMQPSAYIGKLDNAGALTWENGWKTTRGGREVLESLKFDEQ